MGWPDAGYKDYSNSAADSAAAHGTVEAFNKAAQEAGVILPEGAAQEIIDALGTQGLELRVK